jgi:hypothetical protein
MDFSGMPGPGAWLIVASFLCSLLTTALAVVLKLCGVLLLSWWWVFSPLPILLVLLVIIAGLGALFS